MCKHQPQKPAGEASTEVEASPTCENDQGVLSEENVNKILISILIIQS